MVVTSNFIDFIREVPHLRDNIVLETRTPKHTLAKIKWMKEYFLQYIEDEDQSLLTTGLAHIVIDSVNWERIVTVFTGEKTSEE